MRDAGTLSLLGWTQDEISDKLKELFPEAKGTSQQRVAELLPENGNLPLSGKISDKLKAGHSVATVAKRTSQQAVDRLLPKNGNLPLLHKISDKLKAGPVDPLPYPCRNVIVQIYPVSLTVAWGSGANP